MAVSGRKLLNCQGTDGDFDRIKCAIHKTEAIKYFCPAHKELGCSDCIIMNHRTCDILFIPDVCANIENSAEFIGTMWLLSQKVKEIDAVTKKATVRDKEIDACHDSLKNEIAQYRKEINAHLDSLQLKILTAAEDKKSADKKMVKELLETCNTATADINKLQSTLQDPTTLHQKEKLFITIKQAKSRLTSDEIQKSEKDLEKTSVQYEFQRNIDLEIGSSTQNKFGMLNFPALKQKLTLIRKGTVTPKTTSEWFFSPSLITGCAVLSPNELVLADNRNKKLKVVDMEKEVVTEEKKLESAPFDLAVLPQNQIAVTIPEKQEILTLKLSPDRELSTVLTISVSQPCKGIAYRQGYLCVVCQNPHCVRIFDTQGQVQHTISLDNEIFKEPNYIVLEDNSNLVYVSDTTSECIASITLRGDLSAIYKASTWGKLVMALSTGTLEPKGMSILNDGSLLVCSSSHFIINDEKGSIYHISSDLKQPEKMFDDRNYPTSVCYNRLKNELYICGRNVYVYSLN